MTNNSNYDALIHKTIGQPSRQLDYNQVYKLWGYPTNTLPYRQLNRMLRTPAIKYPYNQFPRLINQHLLAELRQNVNEYPIHQPFKKGDTPPQSNPVKQNSKQTERHAETNSDIQDSKRKTQDPSTQSKHHQELLNNSQQKQKKQQKGSQSKQSSKPMISFDKLSVGTISNSSGIFNGKNIQYGWSSHSKTNTGFGTLNGQHNLVNRNINVVFDNDQVDTPITIRDTKSNTVPKRKD